MRNTNPNPESRELKAVSAVIATLALPVYASAAFFNAWDGRVVSLYVGSLILLVAAGVRLFATRPTLFGSTTVGDPLRTRYVRPVAVAELAAHSSTKAPRQKVWTRAYTLMVARQVAVVTAIMTAHLALVVAVTMFLAQADGPTLLGAALLILATFFVIGRNFVINYADEPKPTDRTGTADALPLRPVPVAVAANHGHAA